MTASELISELGIYGVRLQVVEGKIRCTGPAGSLTPGLRATVSRLKPELLAVFGAENSGSAIRPKASIDPVNPNLIETGQETAVLNRIGARIMNLDGIFTVGLWADSDGAEIRRALRALKMDSLPTRYLDEPDIPARYKVRYPA